MNDHIFKFNSEKALFEIEEIICEYFFAKIEEESPQWILDEFDNLFILGAKISNKGIKKYLDKLIVAHEEQIFIHTLKRCCFILLNNWKTLRNYDYCDRLITFLNGVKNNVVIPHNITDELRIRWIIRFLKSDDYEIMKNFAAQHMGADPNFAKYLYSVPRTKIKANLNNTEYVEYLSQKYNKKFIKKYTLKAKMFNEKSLGDFYFNVKNDLYEYLFDGMTSYPLFDLIREKVYHDIEHYYKDEPEKIWDHNLAIRTCNKILDKITISKEKSPSSVFMCLITQGSLNIWINLIIKIVLVVPDCNKYLDHCITSLMEYYRESQSFDFEWLINMLSSIKRYTTVDVYRIHNASDDKFS
jgi:hypothetical protein